jgi:poly(hydroxyalkanoate) depolymerase family esterase
MEVTDDFYYHSFAGTRLKRELQWRALPAAPCSGSAWHLVPGTDAVSVAALWLRSLARAGKVQRRTVNQLFNQLLGQPAAKPGKAVAARSVRKNTLKARAKPKGALKSALKVKTALKAQAKPAARTRSRSAALPGKWLTDHHAGVPQLGALAGPPMTHPMSYWLYLPDKVTAAAKQGGLPLIVMLHGCGQSATQFAQGTRMNRLAEQKGYAVLYPQQSLTSHMHRCWKWYDKATQQGGGDVALIVGIVLHVVEKHGIDRSRLYIAGVSAGAAMADIVALNHPELIAAVGIHSGPVFGGGHSTLGALNLMQHGDPAGSKGAIAGILARQPGFPAMPKILIQGMQDKVVDPINQRQLLQQGLQLNRLASDLQSSTQVIAATAAGSRKPANGYATSDYHARRDVNSKPKSTGDLLLRVTQIEQLDHAWSGGDATLPFNAKEGPDASKMMLDFFALQQRLPVAP